MRPTVLSQAIHRARAAEIAAPSPVVGRRRFDCRVDQVLDADQNTDVRLDGAQDRQVAGGEGQVGELDEGIPQALWPGAGVAGAPGGGGDGLQCCRDLLPADLVEGEAAGVRAVGVLDQGKGPALRGVRLRSVGIEPVQVVADRLLQLPVGPGDGHLHQHPLDLGDVEILCVGLLQRLGRADPGDHLDLPGGDLPRRAGSGHCRQPLERAPGGHHVLRGSSGQSGVGAQPRRHGLQPVDLARLPQLGLAHRAGQLCVDPGCARRPAAPCGRAAHRRAPDRDRPRSGRRERTATRSRHLRRSRTLVRRLAGREVPGRANPQLKPLSTISARASRRGIRGSTPGSTRWTRPCRNRPWRRPFGPRLRGT